MRMDGFKRALLLGMAASALGLAGGCRNEQRGQQGPQYVPSQQPQQQAPGTGGAGQSGANQQPVDINPQPNQEGFKTVPKQETAPHGLESDQGGSGQNQQPVDVNPLPNQEGFKTVPKQETAPNAIGPEQGRGGSGGDAQQQPQGDPE